MGQGARSGAGLWVRLIGVGLGVVMLLPVIIPTARWLGIWRPAKPAAVVRPAEVPGVAPDFSVRTVDGGGSAFRR